jgi:transposase-like protein
MMRCRNRLFLAAGGGPLPGARLDEKKIVSVLAHVSEGCGVRKTGRLVGVNKNTVMRYSRLAGDRAHDLHEELVAFSPGDPRGAVR